MTDQNRCIEIASRVIVLRHDHVEGNTGVIAGDRGALVIDTGPTPDHCLLIESILTSLDLPFLGTILTHGHWDHAFGGRPFGRGEVFAHSEATAMMRREMMRTDLHAWVSRNGMGISELEGLLPWPTVHGEGTLRIDLGGRIVSLLPTPGHSPDSICVLVEDDRVLFGGDTVVTAIPPVFKDGNSVAMEASLSELNEAEYSWVVPGHGQVVTGREAHFALGWAADYIGRSRAMVSISSGDLNQPLSHAGFDDLIGDRLSREKHRMEWRHELTIKTLVDEQTR